MTVDDKSIMGQSIQESRRQGRIAKQLGPVCKPRFVVTIMEPRSYRSAMTWNKS